MNYINIVFSSELVSGAILCVATSPGTEKLLKQLGWTKWKSIDLESKRVDPIFRGLNFKVISSFMIENGNKLSR